MAKMVKAIVRATTSHCHRRLVQNGHTQAASGVSKDLRCRWSPSVGGNRK